jgi:hypothetical protein
MTFGMVRGRSTGVCWPSENGSYLLSGFLVSAHSVARNAMTNTPIYVATGTSVVSEYSPEENLQMTASAPRMQSSSD